MAISKMMVSKMALFCCLALKLHIVPVITFDQPQCAKETEKILDSPPGSHLKTIDLAGRRLPHVYEFVTERLVHW